jgi:hypothetical protein
MALSSFTIFTSKPIPSSGGSYEYFRVHPQGYNCAGLQWATSSKEVIAFVIERSYDGVEFEPAGQVMATRSKSYRFKDCDLQHNMVYYRVIGLTTGRQTEDSPIEEIYFHHSMD